MTIKRRKEEKKKRRRKKKKFEVEVEVETENYKSWQIFQPPHTHLKTTTNLITTHNY